MSSINIAIVDDQRLFRDGMKALLQKIDTFNMVASAENGEAFLEVLTTLSVLPDVVLVDMNMPEMNGVQLTDILLHKYPSIKVIILTVYDQPRFISNMIAAGAAGYLVKNCEAEEVVLAINTVYKSGFYFNEGVLKAMHSATKSKGSKINTVNNIPIDLTDRETEVLQLICKELTNAEIAERLSISPRTVDGHRNNLLDKTGSRNTAGLVLFAVNNHIFHPAGL